MNRQLRVRAGVATVSPMTTTPTPEQMQYSSLVLELDRFEGPQPDDTAAADDAVAVFSDRDGNNVLRLSTFLWMQNGRPGLVRVMMWSAV